MREKPLISVVVPVYKVEGYIERCLGSLAAQTYPYIEVLMVDDCSPDSSGKICDSWAARDKRFLVFHLLENQGLSVARNEGVVRATGEYIAFVDSDDYVEPDLLECLYDALKEGCADISICGNRGQGLKAGGTQVLSPAGAACCMAQRSCFLWTAWGKLFPTELVRRVPFDRQAHCCEDLLFFYQVLKGVRRVAYVPDPLYHYVYREGSLINHGVTEKRCAVLSVLDQICGDAAANFVEAEACFQQVALDTAARLAMQALEGSTEGRREGYLKRFRDYTRRHFSKGALALCPDKKSALAQRALYAGVPAFRVLAGAYRLVKPFKKNRME